MNLSPHSHDGLKSGYYHELTIRQLYKMAALQSLASINLDNLVLIKKVSDEANFNAHLLNFTRMVCFIADEMVREDLECLKK